MCVPRGSLAERGFAKGEGGMMTRGDCGLVLDVAVLLLVVVVTVERTDSVEEVDIVDVMEDSDPEELVRESVC